MHSRFSAFLLTLALLSCRGEPPQTATQAAPPAETTTTAAAPAANDDEALLAAAREYVRKESGPGEFTVSIEQKSGDHARLRTEPAAGETDPATVFMVRRNGQWSGVSLGTGFSPDDLRSFGIPEALWNGARPAYDVTGAYFPMQPLPPEFAGLEHLSLATIDENAAPAPLNGFLRPKKSSAADYKLVNPVLDGFQLTFTTTAVDGVQYAFTGAFAILENFPENPPGYEVEVLTGTLTKLRGGKEIAETPVRFRYEAGG